MTFKSTNTVLSEKRREFENLLTKFNQSVDMDLSLFRDDAFSQHIASIESMYNELLKLDEAIEVLEKSEEKNKIKGILGTTFLHLDFTEQKKFFKTTIQNSEPKVKKILIVDDRKGHDYGLNWLCFNVLINSIFKKEFDELENAELVTIGLEHIKGFSDFVDAIDTYFPDNNIQTHEAVISHLLERLQNSPVMMVLKNFNVLDQNHELLREINTKIWEPLANKMDYHSCPFIVFLVEEKKLINLSKYVNLPTDQVNDDINIFTIPSVQIVERDNILNWIRTEKDDPNKGKNDTIFQYSPSFAVQFEDTQCDCGLYCEHNTSEGFFSKVCERFQLRLKWNRNGQWTIV